MAEVIHVRLRGAAFAALGRVPFGSKAGGGQDLAYGV
jgi:hypothetical protein